jgi:hypothetical protein
MDRNLETIHEHDTVPISSSSDTTGDDLPTVTPRQRSFTDTVNKQNRENKVLLRDKLIREKIAQLEEQLYETEQALDYEAHDPLGGRTPSQQKPVLWMPAPPFSSHGLTPRVPRPQDIAYQEVLKQRQATEQQTMDSLDEYQTEKGVLKLFSKLAQALTDSNNSDVSTPPHFSGKDDEWETWYSQFRTYLKGKGWLDTFESDGPGTEGFNTAINSKIYNKLIILCGKKGYALTYVQNAAEFDGLGAGRQLLARYDGFSRQRNRSLRKKIEQLRHTSGTSMPDHIDLFEKICGQIASSGKPATEEEKLDWFIESVHENTYEPVKAHCNSLKILGTLQFAQMIKLYALTCFAKYPQLQLRALGHKDAPLANNSFTLAKRGRKGKGKPDKGKGRGRESGPTGKGRGGTRQRQRPNPHKR